MAQTETYRYLAGIVDGEIASSQAPITRDPAILSRHIKSLGYFLRADIMGICRLPRYAIYTPYPETQAFKRLQSQKRLLHTNWRYYDTQHVVFQPMQMTPEELDIGFRQAWNATFSSKSIVKRTFRFSKNSLLSFVGNCAYRRYIGRLNKETKRIYYPE